MDENMEACVMEAEGMLARAICHECDHLSGQLYVDLVEGELKDASELTEEDSRISGLISSKSPGRGFPSEGRADVKPGGTGVWGLHLNKIFSEKGR